MKPFLLGVVLFVATTSAFANDVEFDSGHNNVLQDEVEDIAEFQADFFPFKKDLVARGLTYSNTIGDDVNPQPVQLISISVENIGNLPVQGTGTQVTILGRSYRGSVYGPYENYQRLGAPVAPGKKGVILVYIPANTVSHCKNATGQFDTNRSLQSGSGVFLNDGLSHLKFVQTGNVRLCLPDHVVRP